MDTIVLVSVLVSLGCAFIGSLVSVKWPWLVYLPQQKLEPLPVFIPIKEPNQRVASHLTMFQLKYYGGLELNEHMDEAQNLVLDMKVRINALPAPVFPFEENRSGIVTSCKLNRLCLAMLIHLFEGLNTTLPVELWLSKSQTKQSVFSYVQERFAGKGLHIKFFEDYNQKYLGFFGPLETTYKKTAYEVKLQALVCSSFQNVLWVDADLFLLQDGAVLDAQCKKKGVNALFWHDISRIHPQNPIWKVLNVEPVLDRAQESGLVWINKAATWRALYLAAFFNVKQALFYRLLWGDKDTFFLAYEHMKVPYTMMPYAPYTVGSSNQCQLAFIQPDLNGAALALHFVSGKPLVLSKIEHGLNPFQTVAVFDPSCGCTIAGVHRSFEVLKTYSSCHLSYVPADEALGSMPISVVLALKKAQRWERFF